MTVLGVAGSCERDFKNLILLVRREENKMLMSACPMHHWEAKSGCNDTVEVSILSRLTVDSATDIKKLNI